MAISPARQAILDYLNRYYDKYPVPSQQQRDEEIAEIIQFCEDDETDDKWVRKYWLNRAKTGYRI